MSITAPYDLASIKLPRLAGGRLRWVTSLLENRLTRPLLLGRMLRNSGIEKLRVLIVEDEPSFQPYTFWDSPVPGLEIAATSTLLDTVASCRRHPTGFTSVLDYSEAYENGVTTPEDVAYRVLAAIADSDERDPALRVFIAYQAEAVLEQARASTRRWQAGKPLGPFDGVPVAVKDEFDQLPYGTSLGSAFLGSRLPCEEATIVTRFREAGAVLLGKTNMHEFGIGVTGSNPHHGAVRNPYLTDHYAGGSSGGSAAAVAAGLCPVTIGSDGGGSIRIPAAFCGVVGLKPTYGRISSFGSPAQGCSVCQAGPIGATVRDVALAYAVTAGPDARDRTSLVQPPVSLRGLATADVNGLTLGIYRPWFTHADPAIVECCQALLKRIEKRGARLKEVQIPELDTGRIAHAVTILAELASALEPFYELHRSDISREVRINWVLARALSARDYLQAQRIRTRTTAHFYRALQEVDVIVTPTTGCTAPPLRADALPLGESDISLTMDIMRFAVPANFTGLPAITFPAGYDARGLPIGLQAIGRPWEEHVLLTLANAAERLVERRVSPLHYAILESQKPSAASQLPASHDASTQ